MTTVAATKFCINCKHFRPTRDPFLLFDPKYGECSIFPIVYDDDYFLVTGKSVKRVDFYHCRTARACESMCGSEGKRFMSNKP